MQLVMSAMGRVRSTRALRSVLFCESQLAGQWPAAAFAFALADFRRSSGPSSSAEHTLPVAALTAGLRSAFYKSTLDRIDQRNN